MFVSILLIHLFPMNGFFENGRNIAEDELNREQHIFKNSLPLQIRVHEIKRAMGDISQATCLDIGTPNCIVSYHLRKEGGVWHTAVSGSYKASCFASALDGNVHEIMESKLPFNNKTFDFVVVNDFLERTEDHDKFVSECHRILKPEGKLVIHAHHAKRSGLNSVFSALMGLSARKRGLVRYGYTESQLFAILKSGFDVQFVRSYSRFFVTLIETLEEKAQLKAARAGDGQDHFPYRLYAVLGFFYRIAFQVDFLLFLTKGYYLIATAKRRGWRSREAPVLADGRSIAEAVVSAAR